MFGAARGRFAAWLRDSARADATTLAFVDGTFGPDGITFDVTHVKPDGSTDYKDKAVAKFSQGRLTVIL